MEKHEYSWSYKSVKMTIYFVHFGNATAEWMHKKPRRTSERNENPITDKYKANEIATRK